MYGKLGEKVMLLPCCLVYIKYVCIVDHVIVGHIVEMLQVELEVCYKQHVHFQSWVYVRGIRVIGQDMYVGPVVL